MLFKLEKYGIKGITNKWFISYLTERQQCTIVNGKMSNYEYVKTGVPQGTILGNSLFLLFMNDLHASRVTLSADDTMLSTSAATYSEVKTLLLKNNNRLCNWFKKNKLTVNVNKTCSMLIDLILRELLQSVFSVVSVPDNIVQSKLVSVTKMAGF